MYRVFSFPRLGVLLCMVSIGYAFQPCNRYRPSVIINQPTARKAPSTWKEFGDLSLPLRVRNDKSSQTTLNQFINPHLAWRTVISNEWYIWAVLSIASTLGLKSEKTKIGALLSSPLITMVLCLVLCNLGALPSTSTVYSTVLKYIVPVAVPLLLFDADLKKCFRMTGELMKAFLIGSLGTVFGTLVAYTLVPMRNLVGGDKIAAALCARHIGGAVNFVAVSNIINIQPEVVAAALAADNLVVAFYFAFLFVLSAPATPPTIADLAAASSAESSSGGGSGSFSGNSKASPPDAAYDKSAEAMKSGIIDALTMSGFAVEADGATGANVEPPAAAVTRTLAPKNDSAASSSRTGTGMSDTGVDLNSISTALSVSLGICALSYGLSSLLGVSPMVLLSLITVGSATAFPRAFGSISRAGGILGVLFMQLFFSVTGALGHIPTVFRIAPMLLVHTTVQIVCHFLFIYTVAHKALRIPLREVVLASNANVGGPTTASAMASNKRWKELVLPALLTGVFGFAVATQIGAFMYYVVLKRLQNVALLV